VARKDQQRSKAGSSQRPAVLKDLWHLKIGSVQRPAVLKGWLSIATCYDQCAQLFHVSILPLQSSFILIDDPRPSMEKKKIE